MRPSWDPNSPSLVPTIVCYADILGFRAMTVRAHKLGKQAEFLQELKRTLTAAYERMRELADLGEEVPPIFEMKVFTDNIFVACPVTDPRRDLGEGELGILLMLFAEVQARLAADGFLLRGAIAAGDHYQDEDIVFGEALLEAVDLDKSGEPPRLVIAPSVEPLILTHLSWYGGGQTPHHYHLLEDSRDGQLFVNYLGAAFEHFPDGPIDFELLNEHKEVVTKGLQEHGPGTFVYEKYAWAAVYHNYACHAFAESQRFQGGEDVDPYWGAVEAEAQRVLEYLVPFEAKAPYQSPRPLDASRLKDRLESSTRRH